MFGSAGERIQRRELKKNHVLQSSILHMETATIFKFLNLILLVFLDGKLELAEILR